MPTGTMVRLKKAAVTFTRSRMMDSEMVGNSVATSTMAVAMTKHQLPMPNMDSRDRIEPMPPWAQLFAPPPHQAEAECDDGAMKAPKT
jgi:hypothetical protein